MPTICCITSAGDASASSGRSCEPMSTAITTFAPICRAVSTGRLLTSPPSTSARPLISAGANRPGMAMLARIASGSEPWSSTTIWPVCRSVATARYGIGRRSNGWLVGTAAVQFASSACSRLPCTRPTGAFTPFLPKPSVSPLMYRRSSSRLVCGRSARSVTSNAMSARLTSESRFCISPAAMPLAYSPPTTAPMLVPAMQSIGMRLSSSTFRTPRCA